MKRWNMESTMGHRRLMEYGVVMFFSEHRASSHPRISSSYNHRAMPLLVISSPFRVTLRIYGSAQGASWDVRRGSRLKRTLFGGSG